MTSRKCGPCTACCEGWLKNRELSMRPGNPCRHCTAQGCGIYETRPETPCRVFKCGWLADDSPMAEDMRPDLFGAIVLFNRRWRGHRIIAALPTGPAIPDETLGWLKKYAVERATPLVFREHTVEKGRYTSTKKMGFGPPAFVQAVKQGLVRDDVVMY